MLHIYLISLSLPKNLYQPTYLPECHLLSVRLTINAQSAVLCLKTGVSHFALCQKTQIRAVYVRTRGIVGGGGGIRGGGGIVHTVFFRKKNKKKK